MERLHHNQLQDYRYTPNERQPSIRECTNLISAHFGINQKYLTKIILKKLQSYQKQNQKYNF